MEYKNKYSLLEIIQKIKEYNGITRKNKIKIITDIIGDPKIYDSKYVTTFDDDAAAIDIGTDDLLLFATDGIWDQLVEKSPWWAGYAAVLSNINDIYAMGGTPIAMVDVLSSNKVESIEQICKGMKECLSKFNVPIVGGHTHPDSLTSSISISIIGKVNKKSIVKSNTAKEKQVIIEALDLNGTQGPNSKYSWESTLKKNNVEIKRLYNSIKNISDYNLVESGKDISNPGVIGTVCMLCECSNVGAILDLTKIILPDNNYIYGNPNFNYIDWILTHPSSGFVFTVLQHNIKHCIEELEYGGFSTAKIGIVDNTKKIRLKYLSETMELFDFNNETLF